MTYFVNSLALFILLGILYSSGWDFSNPAKNILFQKVIPSKMRATIGSLDSMIFSVGGVIAFPLVGFIADKIGVQNTLALGGFLLLSAALIMWKIREKGKAR